jgi:hypothetical protein
VRRIGRARRQVGGPRKIRTCDQRINRRLTGTSGSQAVVGELIKIENGAACWKLHPNYAAWFWPLMSRVNDLVLLLPEKLLKPMQKGDTTVPPIAPSEEEKREILQLAERQADCAKVYTLAMRGKPALVYKGFPTRQANLAILRKNRGGGHARIAAGAAV